MTYTPPQKLFAIAGTDSASSDMILKVVNAYEVPVPVSINIGEPFPVGKEAVLTTLSAPKPEDENSFAEPAKYVPVTEKIAWPAGRSLLLKPLSINVLRVPKGKGR